MRSRMPRRSSYEATLKATCCMAPPALRFGGASDTFGPWTNAIEQKSLSFTKPWNVPSMPCIQYRAFSSAPSTSVKNSSWSRILVVEIAR